jgi:hypothetical protein
MLYENIRQHPDIYMSPDKEPMFFALEGEREPFRGPGDVQRVRDLETYLSLFRGVKKEKAIGEASTLYLYSPKALSRITHYVPKAKLIAVLRHPVDRAYSHFLCHFGYGMEPCVDFQRALQAEEERRQKGWAPFWRYKDVGFYSGQVARYLNAFDREQISLFLYDDLKNDAPAVIKKIFQFLELDDTFSVNTSIKHNLSGAPSSKWLHTFLTKPNAVKRVLKLLMPEGLQARLFKYFMNHNLVKPPLSAEVRERLLQEYQEDILKTQDLIQRDLSAWLK